MDYQTEISKLWELKKNGHVFDGGQKKIIEDTIELLDQGKIRVAEKSGDEWKINIFAKEAILLYFSTRKNTIDEFGDYKLYDKIPLKTNDWTEEHFSRAGFRLVPGAFVRIGSFIAKNVVLMPSYVNIGAYVDEGTMIDTFATVGSCAQVGKNCHIAGGVGIGGVLEPLQANPVIIEDNCFIGSRCIIVEGARIGEGSVLGMGVRIGENTEIFDRTTGEKFRGVIPPYSVVIPGTVKIDENLSKACAIITKRVDEKTRSKTEINELLRD